MTKNNPIEQNNKEIEFLKKLYEQIQKQRLEMYTEYINKIIDELNKRDLSELTEEQYSEIKDEAERRGKIFRPRLNKELN